MPLLMNKRLVMAKIEGTYGTDPVPVVATDCVLCKSVDVNPLNADYARRDLIRAYLGGSDQIPTRQHATIDIEVELAGMKALGVATPALGALFRACGLGETIVASTSVTYAPVSASFESCTVYFNMDGVLQKMTGCRGTVSLAMKVHEIPTFKFSLIGRYAALTDTAQGTPVYTDFKTPVPVNATNTTAFALHAFSGVLESLDLAVGQNAIFRSLVGGTDQTLITNREATGSIAMEMTTVAAKNWIASINSGTTGALTITHGPAANQCKIDGAKVQLTNAKYQESDGIAMLGADLLCLPTSGNDELSIQFK